MRFHYWSYSKFADWLRGGIHKFPLCTSNTEEWDTWEKAAKAKKFRFWLADDGLDLLQKIVRWPLNLINKPRSYFFNRWIYKTHALTSNLRRGQWHDLDARILHSLFDELVNFVEHDEDSMRKEDPRLAEQEIMILYKWWKEERQADSADSRDWDDYYDEDTEMLIRLIKIRGSLWT